MSFNVHAYSQPARTLMPQGSTRSHFPKTTTRSYTAPGRFVLGSACHLFTFASKMGLIEVSGMRASRSSRTMCALWRILGMEWMAPTTCGRYHDTGGGTNMVKSWVQVASEAAGTRSRLTTTKAAFDAWDSFRYAAHDAHYSPGVCCCSFCGTTLARIIQHRQYRRLGRLNRLRSASS